MMHSSKTMRPPNPPAPPGTRPALLERAEELIRYLRTLSTAQIVKLMSISDGLAERTRQQFADWSTDPRRQSPAAATFVGDIYSGLRYDAFSPEEREYADARIYILSGLYGILRPGDGICGYRLEMGYRLPSGPYANLYRYWGDSLAAQLPADGPIINLAANEYSKAVLPHVGADRIVSPRFLTVDPSSGRPKYVVVHAKIARGAFARWLVTERISAVRDAVPEFREIGYRYDPASSSPTEPVFVCEEFGGKGLSVRLS